MKQNHFTPEAANSIKQAIEEVNGNEVFFVGKINEDSLVYEVQVLARGNRVSVPAIIDKAGPGTVVIHNHPSGNMDPSSKDVTAASIFGNKGTGFYIVDNKVKETYVVVEPYVPGEIVRLDEESAKEYLLPNGSVAEIFGKKYECRDEQLKVLSYVVEAFNDERLSMIEAGTGTGKTFSYLIPSILWAISNKQRVLVSTNTINLQEQLINKDLPILRDIFPEKFDYGLIKGMRNYFCILRGESVEEGLLDFIDQGEKGSIKDVLKWSKTTSSGSISDLSFTPSNEVWDRVSAESESCPASKCPHYSDCFFYRARREISRASVLVSNHHMLFSDIAIKGESGTDSSFGLIPAYSRVVFDEAHNIAEAATSHFSQKLTLHATLKNLSRIRGTKKAGRDKGFVSYITHFANKETSSSVREILTNSATALAKNAEQVEARNEEAFVSLYSLGCKLSGETQISLRLTEDIEKNKGWGSVKKYFSSLEKSLFSLENEISRLLDILESSPKRDSYIKLTAELAGAGKRCSSSREILTRFFGEADENYVKWFEGAQRGRVVFCSINLSPLDVAPELEKKLYAKTKTVVMTSASLAVNKNFDFQKKSLGLSSNNRFRGVLVESPFDYKTQSLLTVPIDIPDPREKNYENHLASVISDAVSITNGNALVLFTSYASLNKVYEETGTLLAKSEGFSTTLFKQGELPRNLLLEKFKTLGNSVLFATDSFWEGVDIPGDSLKLVIICRLPFKVPTDPVTEAKIEYMKNRDIDSFREYFLPHAVLKFKQGFGRLIRTKTDKGVVMVLDKRIESKNYGRFFLNSVSDSDFFSGRTEKVLERIRQFFLNNRTIK